MTNEDVLNTRIKFEFENPVYDIADEAIKYTMQKYHYKKYDVFKRNEKQIKIVKKNSKQSRQKSSKYKTKKQNKKN